MAETPFVPRLDAYWGWLPDHASCGSVQIGGKRYTIVGRDAGLACYLRDVANYLRQGEPTPGRLLLLRHDFRRIELHCGPIGLTFVLESHDYLQQRLAAWLIGRMHWKRGVVHLRKCVRAAPLELQLEIARAMRRLGAWSNLQQLAYQADRDKYEDEAARCLTLPDRKQWEQRLARLKTMCRQVAPRDYASRLSGFLACGVNPSVTSDESLGEPMKLWYQDPLGPGQPPKSRWFIRGLLERIRAAVRGAN